MKSAACLAACFCSLVIPTFAEEKAGDPKDVFRVSAKAIQDAKVISYTIKSHADGWLEEFVPKSEAKVIVGENAEHEVPRFFIEATLVKRKPAEEGAEAPKEEGSKQPPATETVSYKAGSDGNEYYLIDHKTKKAHHDMDPVVLGSDSQNITRLIVREFTDKEPFKNELEAENVTLEATETVDSVECDKVVVEFGKGRPHKAIWHVARTDHLPRRVQRFYKGRNPEEAESFTLTNFSNVQVDPKSQADPFKMSVPDGYAKTDEFAP